VARLPLLSYMVVKDGENILNLAQEVRSCFERHEIPKEALARAYGAYSPGIDAILFVDEADKMFPALNCGIASVYLQTVLGGKVVQGKYRYHPHTFLLLAGITALDITADQYGGPSVYYGELTYPWQLPLTQ